MGEITLTLPEDQKEKLEELLKGKSFERIVEGFVYKIISGKGKEDGNFIDSLYFGDYDIRYKRKKSLPKEYSKEVEDLYAFFISANQDGVTEEGKRIKYGEYIDRAYLEWSNFLKKPDSGWKHFLKMLLNQEKKIVMNKKRCSEEKAQIMAARVIKTVILYAAEETRLHVVELSLPQEERNMHFCVRSTRALHQKFSKIYDKLERTKTKSGSMLIMEIYDQVLNIEKQLGGNHVLA
jgi:hypothetical protein